LLFCFPLPIGKKGLLLSLILNISGNLYLFLLPEMLESAQSSPPKKIAVVEGSAESHENGAEPICCPFLKGRRQSSVVNIVI
jgi:hypothetical protein